jgi:hypothetical protein
MIENIFQKNIMACHAIDFTYPLDVDIILQIFSVITFRILSEFEFCIHWINSSFKKVGIQFVSSMYHGTHNWVSEDWSFSNHDINDCNNSVHRLKKNGISIINPDSTKKVVNR